MGREDGFRAGDGRMRFEGGQFEGINVSNESGGDRLEWGQEGKWEDVWNIGRKKPAIFDFEELVLILRIRTKKMGCDFGGIRQGTRDNRGGFEGENRGRNQMIVSF
jgi:hypothetical protein